MRSVLALLIVAACSSKSTDPTSAPAPAKPTPITTPGRAIELPGDANGLYWDAGEQALYFTDDTHDNLARWSDKDGVTQVATLPAAGAGNKVSFGGLVRLPDGTFVIASFGFGTDGGVVVVDPKHAVTLVPNLDKARRRVGIARAPDGTLYDVYFVVDGHNHHGGLAKLDLAKGEEDVALANLVKPVGVAASADTIYVADQESNAIVAWKANAAAQVATGLPSADLLALLPDGSLVTGGKAGTISRIAPGGAVTTVAKGFEQVRGLAYDPVGKRLFVVDHSKATSNHKLHVVPLS